MKNSSGKRFLRFCLFPSAVRSVCLSVSARIIPATILATVLVGADVSAQQSEVPSYKEKNLQEVVVSVNRMEELKSEVGEQVVLIDSVAISRSDAPTLADVLQQSGALAVQKSQLGGGSPVIRGFEASRILLVIDDVRMNNLIYRSGHLQNILSIDPSVLERTEVLFGPSSTVYGSDALGGVICMRTRQPVFSSDGLTAVSSSGHLRYATAASEKTVQVQAEISAKQWASFTALSYSSFGDLRMGGRPGSIDSVWGTREFYVDRIAGRDTLVRNANPLVQRNTGYDQYDLLQKISFRSDAKIVHGLNLQLSTTSNVPRYDRLTDPASTGLKYAEWYYGPQRRFMGSYRMDKELSGYFSRMKAVVSYQSVLESRHSRSFGKSARTDRTEKVDVVACTVFADKEQGRHRLQVGVDGQYSSVNSSARTYDVTTGVSGRQSTRYPDGGNHMYFIAGYSMHSFKLNDRFSFEEGVRLTATGLRSEFSDTTFYPFPFTSIEQRSLSVSGNAAMIWHPAERFRFSLVGSTGFRAPNVDDLSKVFESVPGSVIVPNPELAPERTWSVELNTSTEITRTVLWQNNFYYTFFRKAVVTLPGTFNGQDSILFDDVYSRVLTNTNQGEAYLCGINSSLSLELTTGWSVSGTVTYTYGSIRTDSSDAPLDHIPPVYGRAGTRFSTGKAGIEAYCLFNGKKDISDYFLNGEDNEQYATQAGMPSWYTVNLRADYRLSEHVLLQAGADNILDQNYRTFASGIQAPGRNLIFSLRVNY